MDSTTLFNVYAYILYALVGYLGLDIVGESFRRYVKGYKEGKAPQQIYDAGVPVAVTALIIMVSINLILWPITVPYFGYRKIKNKRKSKVVEE